MGWLTDLLWPKPEYPETTAYKKALQLTQERLDAADRPLSQQEIDAAVDEAVTGVELPDRSRALLQPYFAALKRTMNSFKWRAQERPTVVYSLKSYIERMSSYLIWCFPETVEPSPFHAWPGSPPEVPVFHVLYLQNKALQETHDPRLEHVILLNYVVTEDHPIYKDLEKVGAPFSKPSPPPIAYAPETRYAHTFALGASGSGKTQLIQHILLYDLKTKNCPSIVVVDSQGDLIEKLSHLKLANDPILISPKLPAPAFNIFSLKGHDEQVINGAIETFAYLFEGLGVELTGKQGVLFRNLCRLVLTFPQAIGRNATILDMLDLTQGKEIDPQYLPAIDALPPLTKRFFEKEFLDREYQETRPQVRARLNAITENPTIAALFTSSNSKLDIGAELNRGSIILIDTAKAYLGEKFSAYYGRFFISLILRAAYEREPIKQENRYPTYLFVDEAHEYFDKSIDGLLTQARKYHIGTVLATQSLSKATTELQASLLGSTATKFVCQPSDADARKLAHEMRTDPQFILSQPALTFACHVRGVTEKAVAVPIPYGELEKEDRLNDEEYDEFLKRNHARLGSPQHQTYQSTSAPKEPPPKWTEQDEQALADAEHQSAIFRRRGNTKRVAELEIIIAEAKARKKASEEYYKAEEEYRL